MADRELLVGAEHLPAFCDQLAMGDVLLFQTDSHIGKIVRLFDETNYNHSGIHIEGGMVMHTGWPGANESCLHRVPLAEAINQMGIRRISVRRSPSGASEIVANAEAIHQAGPSYGYNALLLSAAGTMLASDLADSNGLYGGTLMTEIEWEVLLAAHFGLLDDGLLTCAEFVFRCLPKETRELFPRSGDTRPVSADHAPSDPLPDLRHEVAPTLDAAKKDWAELVSDYRWVLFHLPDLIGDREATSTEAMAILLAVTRWVAADVTAETPLTLDRLRQLLDSIEGDRWFDAYAEMLTPGDLSRAVPPLEVVSAIWEATPPDQNP